MLRSDDPDYATSVHCQRLAGFGGPFSRSIYGSCLNVEQSAALALQSRWSSISASVRELRPHRQLWRVRLYSILQNCVDVELVASGSFWTARDRKYSEVLSCDVGGWPGNPVQYSFRMFGSPRESDGNSHLRQ